MNLTIENFQQVYSMLEDEESKSVYLNRLNYLLSEDLKYIKKIVPQHLNNLCVPTYPSPMIPNDCKIILYGTGSYPKDCFSEWNNDRRIVAFCSNNKEKQRDGYLGYPVISPEELMAKKEYFVVISTIKPAARGEIIDVLKKGLYPQNKIFMLLDKQEDYEQYFPSDIIKFCNNEIFVDAGCYKLETSLALKDRCYGLKKVYAFEPDPINYKACEEKKAQTNFSEVQLFPFGTWSHKDTLYFAKEGTSGATVVNTQTSISVEVVSIDEVLYSEGSPKITFIKMDVEGSELESLKGARKIIQRDRPKLAICIYHKPEDMVDIPLYIKELVPEYKLYVRHHSNYVNETVLYAVL